MSKINRVLSIVCVFLFSSLVVYAQDSNSQTQSRNNKSGYPIVLSGDTLFNLTSGIGSFSTQKRAAEINTKLDSIFENQEANVDSIKSVFKNGYYTIVLGSENIMAVTDEDAASQNLSVKECTERYTTLFKQKISTARNIFSEKFIVKMLLYIALFWLGAILILWLNRLIFPRLYKYAESLGGRIFKTLRVGKIEVLKGSAFADLIIVLFKALRLVATLAVIYYVIVFTVNNLPWTRHWRIESILKGALMFIFTSTAAVFLLKGISALYRYFSLKLTRWKGSLIKPFKIKSVELLSEERAVDLFTLLAKIVRTILLFLLAYFYVTIVFSFFYFSRNWSAKLIEYILGPVNIVLTAVINYLPNLFFIIVILFAFRYLLRLIKFIFNEIDKGTITLPGFHEEWAGPTYKIVRFLIIILAAVIIFPYLPGSDSKFFQGISIFLGIIFSFGSSSSISNIVSGVILTYMRPFRLGDRVKIADTIGDVIEKTLLVTRIRTIKGSRQPHS